MKVKKKTEVALLNWLCLHKGEALEMCCLVLNDRVIEEGSAGRTVKEG